MDNTTTSVVCATAAGALAVYAYTRLRPAPKARTGIRTTDLRGPPRENWLVGQTQAMFGHDAAPSVLEGWANMYGSVYKRPGPIGSWDTFFTDPKAVATLFSHSDDVYHQHVLWRVALENIVGLGLIASDGEDHKRQRKQISPGFTTAKIREYSKVFFACSHKMVTSIEALTEKTGEHVGDIQVWLNALSLDTIGLAGFSHDFESFSDHRSDISNAFEELANSSMGIMNGLITVLRPSFPLVTRIPTQRTRSIRKLKAACAAVAKQFMERMGEENGERSVMGLLCKAQSATTGIPLTKTEVESQIMTILVAGYETTSTTLTWTLIELCRNLELQDKVRKEILTEFPNSDPTFDEVVAGLPLLDAVTQEALRLHPPVVETWRTAQKDDIIPLSTPITLPDGSITDKVVIAEGTTVAVNMAVVNRLRELWGDNAHEFRPERWIEGLPTRAQEISGYRHLLTFLDGPKMCLGKGFAVANMKIALAVILRRFSLELPGGPDTKFEPVRTAVIRVKTAGQKGCQVPMRIRRVE